MVYTDNVPPGTTLNVDYIVGALRKFLKALHQMRPDLLPVERGFPLEEFSSSHCPGSADVRGQKELTYGVPAP
jgi:hypothetical protein